MAIQYQPGKVYLRDTRNGNVYEYERNLAGMAFVEEFVPMPVNQKDNVIKKEVIPPPPAPTMPKVPEVVEATGPMHDITKAADALAEANKTAAEVGAAKVAEALAEGREVGPTGPVPATAEPAAATESAPAATAKAPVPKPPVAPRAVRAPAPKPVAKKAAAKKPAAKR